MKRVVLAACVVVLFAACVAHEKNGDRAASVGDWKTAYFEYREAVAREPDEPAIKEKFAQAKREALADSLKRAQSCAATQQWQCAVGEADFALQVEPGDASMTQFRQEVGQSFARQRLAEARAQAQTRDFKTAFASLEEAAKYAPPALAQEQGQARGEVAQLADAEAERLRQQRAYPEAIQLLTLAAAVDGTKAPRLDGVRQEYEQFLDAEHERIASEGDAALAARDWARAQERYMAATSMRPQGRAAPLVRYTASIQQGEAGLGAHDYVAAANAYRQAISTGQDRSNYANERLQAVELRPFTVRIRSVLALPTRPDGSTPWVAGAPGMFMPRQGLFRGSGRGGARTRAMLIAMASQVPMSNRPNLAVIALMPDGTQLATPTKRALYTPFDSRFTVFSNAFEERVMSFRVVHRDDAGDVDVGTVDVPLRDLLHARQGFYEGGAVAALELQADPLMGAAAADVINMQPEPPPGQPRGIPTGPPQSRPSPTATRP